MRRAYVSVIPVVAVVLLACNSNSSKAQVDTSKAAAAPAEASRQVAGGGVEVKDWTGKIDPNEARRGGLLSGAKLTQVGKEIGRASCRERVLVQV